MCIKAILLHEKISYRLIERVSIIVCMQPTYLPWIGYFDLIDQSDHFIFLDNVQFTKRSWQQRNRIVTAKGLEWLTVPVKVKGRLKQLISHVAIDNDAFFYRKHLRAIELNYRKTPFFDIYFPQLESILSSCPLLCELNTILIRWTAEQLGIQGRFYTSSTLDVTGKRSELLVNLCNVLGGNVYLSPQGSAEYLLEDKQLFDQNKINIMLHNYEHPSYRQIHEPFTPYATALDLLFNEGGNSLAIIRSGRKQAGPL
ncbi:MAG: hypothetical protein D3906_00645 [Candidatus Electrothrix sp. AUS1_2]|nr:hypothetical protein [Candidatus Electrothrix sp. AUS1_2]